MDDPKYFRWRIGQYKHRLGFDIERNRCLGLIRSVQIEQLDEPEDGNEYILSVAYVDDGVLRFRDFDGDMVGCLDIHPAMLLTAEELVELLDRNRKWVDQYREELGAEDEKVQWLETNHKLFVDDVKDIMLANHCYTRHDYQSLMTQYFLMGLG